MSLHKDTHPNLEVFITSIEKQAVKASISKF